jgi:TonB family protein
MREKDVFNDAFFSQPSLLNRLIDTGREAKREFSENPWQYLTCAIKGEGIGGRLRTDRLKSGLALALAIYMIVLGVSILLSVVRRTPADGPLQGFIDIRLKGPGRGPQPPTPPDPKQERGGGGGGGSRDLRDPSGGELPLYAAEAPVIAPTTRPALRPPDLPVLETVRVDPRLQPPRDEIAPTGIPNGPSGPLSDGPGYDGGIGTGHRGGVGPGDGIGVGPGKNWGIGGEDGGSRGRPRVVDATQLSARPIPLNHPRPNYTEAARQQRVQGIVRASVLVGSDGLVKSVRILSGLPDGLDEEAICAAHEMRFRAAQNNGHPVSAWVTLEIEFNLR